MVQLGDWLSVWDRTSDLVKQQAAGVAVYERLNKFLLEFARLQNEAFAAQRKLCEKYVIDTEKCFGFENSYGDAVNAFFRVAQMLVESENLISYSFEIQGNGDFRNGFEDQKRKLKRWKHDREKLASEMKSQVRIIDDEIKRYRDKFRDMVKSTEEYTRIEGDKAHSQLDAEKALMSVRLKSKDFDRARKDYEAALNQFNLYRKDHFTRTLPLWAEVGYELGQERYARTQTLFNILFERFRVTLERLNCVCTELQNVPEKLCFNQDMDRLLSHLRTGIPHPGDIAFVDLASTITTCPPPTPGATDEKAVAHCSLAWPPILYPSVSAADLAAREGANSSNGGQVYAGTGSLYSNSSGGMITGPGSINRRPSTAVSFGGGNGAPGLFRRLFSRRSRSVATLGYTTDGVGESDYPSEPTRCTIACAAVGSQHELRSPSHTRDLLDSSDFSDASFDSDQKPPNSGDNKPTAYAETSVLIGIQHLKTTDQSSYAPLAEPESASMTCVPRQNYKDESANEHSLAEVPSATNSQDGESQYETNVVKPSSLFTGIKGRELLRTNGLPSPNQQCGASSFTVAKSISSSSAAPDYSHEYAQPTRGSYASSCQRASPCKDRPYIQTSVSDIHKSSACRSTPAEIFSNQTSREIGSSQHNHGLPKSDHNSHVKAHQPYMQSSSSQDTIVVVGCCTALYSFEAQGFESCYLPFETGEKFYILASSDSEDTSEWIRVVRLGNLEMGYVPTSYMKQQLYAQSMILPSVESVTKTESHSPFRTRRLVPDRVNTQCTRNELHSHRLPKSSKPNSPLYSRLIRSTLDTDL